MRTGTTDVLIVGAGPTGLTLATALATRGIPTTVVDREAAGANHFSLQTSLDGFNDNTRPVALVPALASTGLP